jgi:DNA mismatch endonuclease (patch repair protein)
MRAIRSENTTPELRVRRFLHGAGLRYRLYDKRLPGKPDLVFPSRRVALFVHGCFWHQHPGCKDATRPKSHHLYWEAKLDGNSARDARRTAELATLGWQVLVIWECETQNPKKLRALATRIKANPQHRAAMRRIANVRVDPARSRATTTETRPRSVATRQANDK